jgi:iron(III) transport system permease protein
MTSTRSQGPKLLHAFAALAITGALLLPLVLLYATRSSDSTASHVEVPLRTEALVGSLAVSAVAALIAVALGAAFALLFTVTDLPGSTLWATLLLLAFACPATVWSLGQLYCYGAGGLVERWTSGTWRTVFPLNAGNYLATTIVLAQIHVPLACLVIARGVERLHHAGLESAMFYLRRLRLLGWYLAGLRRELASAALLTFALSASNFAVPHVLQCRLYPIEVYQRMTNYLDPQGAAYAAFPLAAATFVAALAFAMMTSGGATSSEMHPPRRLALGRWKWAIVAMVAVYFAITALLPGVALLTECKSPAYFLSVVRDALPEVNNTLRIALGAAIVAYLAGLAIATTPVALARVLADSLAVAAVGIPTLIVGLAYATFFNRASPVNLTMVGSTSLLVVLGLGFRAWPFATRVLRAGLDRSSPLWCESASLAQMPLLRRWLLVCGPLIAQPMAAAVAISYLIAVGDVEISQMLCAPGGGTVAMRLFTFLHFGPTHVAANLALLLILLTGLPVWLWFVLASRRFAL